MAECYRFELGSIMITPGALLALREAEQQPLHFLRRHAQGDWGEVCDEDKQLNDGSLLRGERLLSAYCTSLGERLWIITEADRSSTTILLPSEY